MQYGYVAFLDVLGFTSLLAGSSGASRLAEYKECLKQVLEEKAAAPPEDATHFDMTDGRESIPSPAQHDQMQLPDVAVFSDSIVLVARDDSDAGLLALVRLCSRLLAEMLSAHIALRGSIAYGPYERARLSFGSFFAGSAIVDAYRFESSQDWVGIMLAPSAVERVPDLAHRCSLMSPRMKAYTPEDYIALANQAAWAAFLQRCPRIPFHPRNPPWDDNAYDGFAIVPTRGVVSPESIVSSLNGSLKTLIRLKSLAPNPESQAKYDRTHNWLQQHLQTWQEISHGRSQLIQDGKLLPNE